MIKPFRTIKDCLIENRAYIAAGLTALLIVDVLQVLIPRIIKAAVDPIVGGTADLPLLQQSALVLTAIAAGMACCRFIWRYCIIGASRRIERTLRSRLFDHIIRLPLKIQQQTPTGDLMARMTNDLEAVRMCTGIGLVAMVDTILLGLASISCMLYISVPLTAACLLPLFAIIFVTWLLSTHLHRRFAMVQAAFSALTETIRDTLSGIAVVKAYAMERHTAGEFAVVSHNYARKNMSLVRIMALFFPIIMFFSNLSVGVLLLAGGKLAVVNRITPGDFVAFASYLWILTWPMMALGWVVNLLQRGSASMIRINDILSLPRECSAASPAGPLQLTGAIDIRNLTFSHAYGSAPCLKNISLSIRSGQTIAITGSTGSGKSTLCMLLQRMYSVPAGTIFFDGIDITSVPIAAIRSSIAFAPQDGFLFSESIHNNIAFFDPTASPASIRQLAAVVQMADEIKSFSDGFNTIVGERGVTLSGGQRQRLCIARALLKQAPILIIDDCLASLDSATAQQLSDALRSPSLCRTTIIVSHRIASIMHADSIFVLSGGEILQAGTHIELAAADGLYRALYLKQLLEEQASDRPPPTP